LVSGYFNIKMDIYWLTCLLLLCVVEVFNKPTYKNERVHFDPELRRDPHEDNRSHRYDHEAFLGKEEAATFDQLTPEVSKERLGKIVDRIDGDKDGYVTTDELKSWINRVQKRYIYENVAKVWTDYDLNKDNKISWDEYKKATYGYYLDELKSWINRVQKRYIYENVAKVWTDYDLNKDNKISWDEYKKATYGYYLANPEEFQDATDQFSFKKMLPRDERRFKTADLDGDTAASREEFTAFLHPEEFDHMKDIVVLETLEDIDKNGDGHVDEDEYIADMFAHEVDGPEPDWVKTEREQFADFRDTNKDGKMDKEEIRHWILPQDYDHALAEARHLVYESDLNKDQLLTKEEILENWNMFVGSQATNYGEDLTKNHDEL
ncbi:UNVERIFIED_CONTAM: hypothetical protein FKN15_005615, partial [Acipenser sinensis]